jgi:hypothetical protein
MSETANDSAFRFLRGLAKGPRIEVPVRAPDDPEHDYYRDSGAHPDIVERLWDQLGKDLPVESRALVFGRPAIIHPQSGIVLAFSLGTEYALRLPRAVAERRPAGLRTVAKWSGGGSTDIAHECGREWIFGSFADAELEWCKRAFDEHAPPQSEP